MIWQKLKSLYLKICKVKSAGKQLRKHKVSRFPSVPSISRTKRW